jgi:hypothetical protein
MLQGGKYSSKDSLRRVFASGGSDERPKESLGTARNVSARKASHDESQEKRKDVQMQTEVESEIRGGEEEESERRRRAVSKVGR